MKKLLTLLSFFLIIFSACQNDDCLSTSDPACSESVPNQEVTCLAYFESWFYDEATSTCSKIGYSGCNASGFETKEACEACDCNQ